MRHCTRNYRMLAVEFSALIKEKEQYYQTVQLAYIQEKLC